MPIQIYTIKRSGSTSLLLKIIRVHAFLRLFPTISKFTSTDKKTVKVLDVDIYIHIYTTARVWTISTSSYTPYGHHLELARGERRRQLRAPLRALPK